MKRTRLFLAATSVAVLALAACGSTEGTPTAEDTGVSQVGNSADGGPQSGAADASADEQATGADSADGDANDNSDAGDTADEGADGDTAAKTGATTTIAGDLDAQSAAWFSEMCTGAVKPMINVMGLAMGSAMAGAMGGMSGDESSGAGSSGAPKDPKKVQQTLVASLHSAAKAMGDTGKKLASMPPPTIDHGAEAAKAAVSQMKTMAAAMDKSADQLAAAKVTDMASLSAALGNLSAFTDDMDNLNVNDYVADDKTQNEIMNLPACQDAFGPFAGLASMGSMAPPTS